MKEEVIKTTDDMEAVVEFAKIEEELLASDFEDVVSEGIEKKDISNKKDDDSDNGSSKTLFLLSLISLPIIIFLFIKKGKTKLINK